jgi:NADH-quinone oxidoreductase subunit E
MSEDKSTTQESAGEAEVLGFSTAAEQAFQTLLTRYPKEHLQAAVIPALHLAQEDFGYVSVRAMEYVAARLDMPASRVLSVATFYTMFNRHPVCKRQVNVCTSPPCFLMGSDWVVQKLEQRFGVKVGQTTPDKRFTLGRAECLASCGTAPMLECNGMYYENLTPEKLDELLDRWEQDAG